MAKAPVSFVINFQLELARILLSESTKFDLNFFRNTVVQSTNTSFQTGGERIITVEDFLLDFGGSNAKTVGHLPTDGMSKIITVKLFKIMHTNLTFKQP